VNRLRKCATTALGCCLGLGLLQAEAVLGSTFKVNPIQIVLSGATTSALLTLTNESQGTLRFEVTAFAWTQDSTGEMKLQPTRDIVFFPKLFSVAPGGEQKIRVGATVSAGDLEKTYRIFVEELHPLEKPSTTPAGSQVRVLTKMGIPIFLQPSRLTHAGNVVGLKVDHSVLSFAVNNTGNCHFSLYGVRAEGRAADGTRVFERKAEGWYVLVEGSRAYEIPLTASECDPLKQIVVTAQTDIGELTARLDVPPGACVVAPSGGAAGPAKAGSGRR
jgi:fimbrial chaperone protein